MTTPAETHDDVTRDNLIPVFDLRRAEARYSLVDEYILVRFWTDHDEEFWFRLTRANFLSLSQWWADEARRLKGH